MRLSIFFLLILLGCTESSAADYHYKYTQNCSRAYQSYLSMDTDKGDRMLKQELLSDPYNLMATYVADYKDCILLLFNGDKRDYSQLKHHQNERLKLLERGDEYSPWHRLCKAGIYMHWAFVHLRFNEKLDAASCFRKSFLLLKENEKLYPSFSYNDIFFGIEQATVGAIPDNFKWIATLFGMRGDVNRGIGMINKFVNSHKKGDPLYEEALVYSAYMHYYLMSDKEKAWTIVTSNDFDTENNLINSFVKANIALNYRKAEEAKKVLEHAATISGYADYPVFEYEYGYALLHKLDTDAITHFRRFLKNYNGKMFVKDAWQKSAYYYYIFDNNAKAEECRKRILSESNDITDSDKQALRFAEHGTWPHRTLLKVQLLTDGGYYNKAIALLKTTNEASYTSVAHKLEYYFRQARVQDELGDAAAAIINYKKAIEIGKDRQEQFAARSALQLGFLYEDAGATNKAVAMYELALSMKNHDFQNSIDQQAKAGINRLTQK